MRGERSLNATSTASRLMFVHFPLLPPPPSPTTTSVLALAASNFTYHPGDKPLPSIEGCGLPQDPLRSLRSEVTATVPPLSKGMWVVHSHIDDACSPMTTMEKKQRSDYNDHDHLDAEGDEA